MKKKIYIIFIFSIFSLIIINSSFHVVGQSTIDYKMEIEENDVYVWKVAELNKTLFEEAFGFKPLFDIDDQIKILITQIIDAGEYWSVHIKRWDYKDDWSQDVEDKTYILHRDPSRFEDHIFLPIPVDEFLKEIESVLTEYSVDGYTLIKRFRGYIMEREYDPSGVLFSETYKDDDDNIIVKVEGTFRIIPLGNYYFGFIIIGILSITIITLKKKKIQILSS